MWSTLDPPPSTRRFEVNQVGPTTARGLLSEDEDRLGRRGQWRGSNATMLVTPRALGALGWEVAFRGSEMPISGPPPLPPVCPSNITLPTVRLFHSSCDPSGNTGATIQLLCLIDDFAPGDIEVTWLEDGRKTEGMSLYNGPLKQEGNLSSTFSWLNVTQGQWVSQSTYTCQVNYQGCTLRANARNCPGTAPPCLPPAQG